LQYSGHTSMGKEPQTPRPRKSPRILLISLAVLVVLWFITSGTGGLFEFTSERTAIEGTYDHVEQTEDCDVVRIVTFSFAGRKHRFVVWSSRVKGMPVVPWAE
jgi:hypothetical protein